MQAVHSQVAATAAAQQQQQLASASVAVATRATGQCLGVSTSSRFSVDWLCSTACTQLAKDSVSMNLNTRNRSEKGWCSWRYSLEQDQSAGTASRADPTC